MKRKYLVYSLLSVLLLSIPWLGAGGITLLIAFVPLLMLQDETLHSRALRAGEKARLKREGKKARVKGMPFWVYPAMIFALWWGICTWWVGIAFVPGPFMAAVIGSLLCTSAFMIYDYFLRKGPRILAYIVFVAAWISYELLYIKGAISFPWLTLGGGFANNPALVQWYEFTGMLGGSAWVLVCNLCVFEAVKSMRGTPRWKIAPTLVILLPMAISLIMYHTYREGDRKVSVRVVQPSIDPYTSKFVISEREQLDLIMSLIKQDGGSGMDYILLPETAFDDNIWENDYHAAHSLAILRRYIFEHSPGTTIITGAVTQRSYPDEAAATVTAKRNLRLYGNLDDHFNSAISLDTTDRFETHHKSLLVIGVEKYHPLIEGLQFMIPDLGGMIGNYGTDSIQKVFTSPSGVRTAAAICYESVYGEYFSSFVRNGAEVVFIITNDGWWGNTPGYRNHFSFARLRAIENRRSIARSANTGISGFINQRGDVISSMGWYERGVLDAELSLNDRLTFYTRHGDLIGRASVAALALSIVYLAVYRLKKQKKKI